MQVADQPNAPVTASRILRLPEVVKRTGLSRSSVYGRIRAGEFPAPVHLGAGRAIGFLEREIHGWIDSLAERRTEPSTQKVGG
jgi:prophage regulatory protein